MALAFEPRHADPLARILRAYDRAIDACESFDDAAARSRIGLLRRALQLDTPEARSFDALFAWCERAVDRHDFVGPARCLRSLRAAWCRAADPRPLMSRNDLPLA